MGNSFAPRFESAFCVIEVPQIIIHEADEPKPVFDLFDAADALSCKDLAQIDFAGLEADAATGGDDDAFVIQRMVLNSSMNLSNFASVFPGTPAQTQ
jgi:hypothetical protein